ncbi:30S ribosomal protein S6, partial [Acetobacteraceae bacterium]|nr:30S ribosomal protein S6 [Candidatus Parcubacteria bacterium]
MAEMSQAVEASTQANAPKDPRPVYEVGFHVVPTVSEETIGAVVEKIRSELSRGNAEILSEQMPQKITLAYVIERSDSSKHEKYAEAYFGWIKFATEKEYIPALEGMLRS